MGDVITQAVKYEKGWTGGLPETPCGHGSMLSNTNAQRIWIPAVIKKYGIRTVSDIGAGDLNWIRRTNLGCNYTPYDLVPRHPDVIEFDLVNQVPQKVDMIMCLWVLNHFPYDHCQTALENIKKSGSRYLMMTDRPIWRIEQPPEIGMPYIEELVLIPAKGDRILLIDLEQC